MHYTAEEKVTILRLHLLEEKTPISDLCDEVGLQPTVLYRWQKEFFENGAAAFQPKGRSNHPAEQERITYLERKIQTKHEVLAEHVALKKVLRNSDRSQGTARYAEQAAGDLVMLESSEFSQRSRARHFPLWPVVPLCVLIFWFLVRFVDIW